MNTCQRTWRPQPAIAHPMLRRALWSLAILYALLATMSIDIDWGRAYEGLDRGLEFVEAFMRPDFSSRWTDILDGVLESLTMTFAATVLGVILSVPIALGASRNLAPLPVYLLCRAIISISRTFQEVIIAILFVAMFGFGPLAGVITLAFASIGFLSKLLAEDIEDSDPAQLEAIRATGSSWMQSVVYGIVPQVLPRFIGLSAYRLDINFRESAVIGIVGAGGIGATLNTAFDRYEYDTAAAILLIIIGIVLLAEYGSSFLRKRLQ